MLALLATGLVAILGQVVLLRELSVVSFGTELVYLLGIGAWLVGGAVGALLPSRSAATLKRDAAWLLVAFGVCLPAEMVFIRASRAWFGGVPGAFLPIFEQVATIAGGILPAAALCGVLFQRAARTWVAAGGTLAGAYAIESAGGVVGGALAAISLHIGVGNLAQSAVAAVCAASAGAALVSDRSRLRRATAATVAVLLGFALGRAGSVDAAMTRWTHPGLADTFDTPYGRITVTEAAHQVVVFENDALAFETEGVEPETLALLALLQHPSPSRILLLGGAAEGVLAETLAFTPLRVDVVELDRARLTRLVPRLPARRRRSLSAAGVSIEFADPRRFLANVDRYDAILLTAADPASGQANRLYTQEFFGEVADRLGPGGVFGFSLHAAETAWTPFLAARVGSVIRALRGRFRDVVVLPGTTLTVLASPDRLPQDPEVLVARLESRHLTPRLVSPPLIRYLYDTDRRRDIAQRIDADTTPSNTDIRPICYQLTTMVWLSKFVPALGATGAAGRFSRVSGALLTAVGSAWLLIVLLGAWRRRQDRLRRTAIAGAAGFVGMLLETVIVLEYQTTRGVLYQDIGMLLTMFMAGLAAGAWLMRRSTPPSGDEAHRVHWRRGAVPALGLALTSAAAAWVTAAGLRPGLVISSVLLGATGLAVAGLFAFASETWVGKRQDAVAPLYAADLAGGALGAAVATLWLVPAAGLDMTAWLGALVALTTLPLL